LISTAHHPDDEQVGPGLGALLGPQQEGPSTTIAIAVTAAATGARSCEAANSTGRASNGWATFSASG
jgi:hypothetical protein